MEIDTENNSVHALKEDISIDKNNEEELQNQENRSQDSSAGKVLPKDSDLSKGGSVEESFKDTSNDRLETENIQKESENNEVEQEDKIESIPENENRDSGNGKIDDAVEESRQNKEAENIEKKTVVVEEGMDNKLGKEHDNVDGTVHAAIESGGEEDRPIVQLEATELDLVDGADMDEEEGGKLEKDSSLNFRQKRREENDSVDVHSKRIKRWNKDNVIDSSNENNNQKVKNNLMQESITDSLPRSNSQRVVIQRGNSFKSMNLTLNSVNTTPSPRTVPPSSLPATNSLRINNFVRPFTQKQLSELLAKTGKVEKFWMDAIRTHCFVTYSSVEEATDTRNSLYNLQWPPQGGKLLNAHFVNPNDVDSKLEQDKEEKKVEGKEKEKGKSNELNLNTNENNIVKKKENNALLPSPSQHPPPPPPLPSPPASNLKNENVKEEKKEEIPVPTLDDLFQKTKAKPQVYFLPLTENQVSKKLEAQKFKVVKPV